MSLRGPVLTLTLRCEAPILMASGGRGTAIKSVLQFSSYFVEI